MANKDRDDKMQFEGVVLESNKGIFKVMVTENHIVNCKIGGKLKMAEIKIIVGDKVLIEVSPYNLNLGRLTFRLNEKKNNK